MCIHGFPCVCHEFLKIPEMWATQKSTHCYGSFILRMTPNEPHPQGRTKSQERETKSLESEVKSEGELFLSLETY